MATETRTLIGKGKHTYEVIDQWGKLPAGLTFGTTHGVVEDSKGRILIHHTGRQSVVVLDPDGNYISSWGDDYQGGAHGMYLNREQGGEFLYLSTTSLGFVAKTSIDGREVFRIGTPDRPDIYDQEKKFVPTETAVAPDGRIYVADGYGQPWIHVYTKEARYITSFGGPGKGKGQLDNPHGIKIDTRGSRPLVLVSDRGNSRLQYFTLDGEHARFVQGDLRKPCTTIQWQDEIYIPDLYSRLTVLDKKDRLITHLGDREDCWKKEGWPNLPKSDWVVGKFSSPHDLHVDRSGNIYIVEWLSEGTGKITKLVRQA
jgi:DNA-binding beta-propeller fold protein YncE